VFATLVAVTVMIPGEFGATYVAVVVVCALNVPVVAVQVTPWLATSFVTAAVKFSDCPSANPPRTGVSVTLIGAPVFVTVIVAAPDFVVAVTEVAVNVTVGGDGRLAGAVYVTAVPEALAVGATVPHVAPLQPAPDNVHVTPLFTVSFVTVAVKGALVAKSTLCGVGATVTPIGPAGDVTVIPAAACLVGSDTDVATSTTSAGLGIVAGAVYVTATPDALDAGATVPQVAPVQPVPDSVHVTPCFAGSLATVAVNVVVAFVITFTAVCDKLTTIGTSTLTAVAVFVESVTDVAVTVTSAGLGTFGGAVYVTPTPEGLFEGTIVPHAMPVQPAPESAHVTP